MGFGGRRSWNNKARRKEREMARGMRGKKKPRSERIPSKGGTAHPGFKNVASDIARKQGVSKERADAILASQTRKASASAKKKNPRLKKV